MSTEKNNKEDKIYKEPAPKLRQEDENPQERKKSDKRDKKHDPKD